MKNIIKLIVFTCICALLASCATFTDVTIRSTPGTEVFNSRYHRLGVVDETGSLTLKVSDNDYFSFLLSRTPSSDDFIPFALDYNYEPYLIDHSLAKVGKVMTYAGAGILGAGLMVLVATAGEEDEELSDDNAGLALGMEGAGLGISLLGVGTAIPFSKRTEQITRKYCYKLQSIQNANQDLQVTKPKFDLYKEVATQSTKQPQSKAANSNNSGASVSSKTLKDNATKVEGTYIGKGSLMQNKKEIESYEDISIIIKRSAKDVVSVSVVESNGDSFFTSDGEYTVKKLSNGKYELTMKNEKNAIITIDTKSNLVYIHPRVNIDSDIYTLNIKANKK